MIIINVHGPTEDKINDIKDRFYKELEHVFDKLLPDCKKHNQIDHILIYRRRHSGILDVRSSG
jgi:hypothetical protein